MYLNNASEAVKALEITSISYNGALVYEEGIINVAAINVAVNTAFTLNVTAVDGKYNFTNAKLYDGIYENTTESRKAFVMLSFFQ